MLPWFIIVWLPSSQLIHINSKDHSTRTTPNNLRSLRSRWDLREDGWMYTDKACSMALNLCLPAQQAGRTSAGQLVQSYKLAFTHILSLFCSYACLVAFLLWPLGAVATFPGNCSDGSRELPPLPLGALCYLPSDTSNGVKNLETHPGGK